MSRIQVGVYAVLLIATAFVEVEAADVIYSNDFSSRQSRGAVPLQGVWREATPYPTANAELSDAFNSDWNVSAELRGGVWRYVDFTRLYLKDMGDGRPSYDGWFVPDFSSGTATSKDNLQRLKPGVYIDQGDPCFRFFYKTDTARRGVVLHDLHNVFTNGQLKIQVDLRAPEWWETKSRQFWVFPVFNKYMSAEAWDGKDRVEEGAPGLFGLRVASKGQAKTYGQYYDPRKDLGSVSQLFNNETSADNHVYWFRYEVTYDLDAARFAGSVKSLSGYITRAGYKTQLHPTFETAATTTKTATFSNALWLNCETNKAGVLTTDLAKIWQEKGGLSGLGFSLGALGDSGNTIKCPGETVVTNKVFADNIRVSWKRPGAEEFALVYENDFKNRKYRTVSGPSSTALNYDTPTVEAQVKADVFAYETEKLPIDDMQIVPTAAGEEVVQPVGVDGWRRLTPTDQYGGYVAVARDWEAKFGEKSGPATNRLEIGRNAHGAMLAQTLGESVTEGKVRVSMDVCYPDLAPYAVSTPVDLRRVCVGLGDASLYTATGSEVVDKVVAAGGIAATSENSTQVPFCLGASGPILGADVTCQWYRYDLRADLDAKTFDFIVTPIGAVGVAMGTEIAGDPVFSQTGVPFTTDQIEEISTVVVQGWGYGGNRSESIYRTYIDNLRVWTVVGSNETLIYANDFDKRTRTVQAKVPGPLLAYEYNRADGLDGWVRRDGIGEDYAGANGTLRSDEGNACLSLGRIAGNGHSGVLTTSLGSALKTDRVRFRVDVRPPARWQAANGCLSFDLGGAKLAQSQILDVDADRVLRIGLWDHTGVATGKVGYEDIKACCVASADGDAVGSEGERTAFSQKLDPSHWYRLEAVANLEKMTFRASVYDQGTSHPSKNAQRGVCVGSIGQQNLLNPLGADGISTLAISFRGIGATFGDAGADPFQAQVDNIEVLQEPMGMMLIVR